MGTGSMALRAQRGAISAALLGLSGVAGFAAGALVVGVLMLGRNGAPAVGSAPLAAPNGVPHDAVAGPTYAPRTDWPAPGAPSPWAFESASQKGAGAPGRSRPDRLSGPEGWTYEPALTAP